MKKDKRRARFGRLASAKTRRVGALRVGALTAPDAGAPFTVLKVSIAPGKSHPSLWHAATSEFFLVLEGSATAVIAGRTRRFARGDFAFMPPLTPHAFKAGKRGVQALAIFMPPLSSRRPDIVLDAPPVPRP